MLKKNPQNRQWIYKRFLNEIGSDIDEPEFPTEGRGPVEVLDRSQRTNRENSSLSFEDGIADDTVYSLPPSASSPTCLSPNPDPPEFNEIEAPITIEPRGSFVPQKQQPRENRVDPFYADSLNLQTQILHAGGVEVYAKAADLLWHVAFVEIQNRVWVAGWNSKMPSLHGLFHIGDEVVSVNGRGVSSLSQLTRGIQVGQDWASAESSLRGVIVCSSEVKCRLRLRRAPLAKTLIVCRQFEGQQVGVTFCEDGTNKVKRIEVDGPLACTGLVPFANPFFKKTDFPETPLSSALRFFRPRPSTNVHADLVPWFATEINHSPLNLFFNQHEASLLIGARGLEIAVTFQPSDFIEVLRRKLKKLKAYRTYCQ